MSLNDFFYTHPLGAEFSADRLHRELLWRVWSHTMPRLGFLMLNPSSADETRDDPTTVRNMARARALGYGGVVQANLYTFRTPSPAVLKREGFPGARRELVLARFADRVADVVCAWGGHAREEDARWAIAFLRALPKPPRLLHLGRLKARLPGGRPTQAKSDVLFRHPLHTAYSVPLEMVPA